jgi:hypothetical protein
MANENVLVKPTDTRSTNDATMYADEGDEVSVGHQVPSGSMVVEQTVLEKLHICCHLDLYFARKILLCTGYCSMFFYPI